ncbi:MAG: hypothetical protein CSA05_01485 [Bacteroidia bacterium]|nr:MAG: hypothetical protein CSB01_01295 [Bacteroidia bacterium]PIE86213.1 MAG: hypothetical protein CSA05_01485 [Bacteroidia bacterium]
MNEELLQYAWKFKLFGTKLQTVSGEELEIISAGTQNTDAGPDFLSARIKIDALEWAGNIEIHKNASDWEKHEHHKDESYDSVILHVVANNDKDVYRSNGKQIPCVKISLDASIVSTYKQLKESTKWIPCEEIILSVDYFSIKHWLSRLMIERLEAKSIQIAEHLKQSANNWEVVFYHQLAHNFGFKLNSMPFELLAKSTPLLMLAKHKNQLAHLEAILFGQAGMLEKEIDDEYYKQLQKNYAFFKKKFSLSPIEDFLWKFLRLRPVNFPTIRISQFAALIYQSNALFSKIISSKKLEDIEQYFQLQASEYWDTHYTFDKKTQKRIKRFGKSSFYNIAINTILPFMFTYGRIKGKENLQNKALDFYENIKAENNHIIKKWKEIGIAPKNAFESQALLQLKNEYCTNKKCLKCNIGNKLFSKKS